MNEIKNKIKAVMIGHAIGDALGVPVEFSNREKLEKSPVTDMIGYGTFYVPAGTWSDDTSMSIAALDVIINEGLDWDHIMVSFGKWYYGCFYTATGVMFDIGNACRCAIDNYYIHKKPVFECGLSSEFSNGNGSLMRIHPFSLLTWYNENMYRNCEEIISKASSLTHAHDRSKLACNIYTLVLHSLLNAPSKDSIMSALAIAKEKYGGCREYFHFERLFSDEFSKLTVDKIKSSGYVVDTLEAAVWCVLTTDNFRDCVLKAVNLCEDTDTVAAIAGGLAGALYGYQAIPKEWKDGLIKRDYLEDMCDKAASSWSAL